MQPRLVPAYLHSGQPGQGAQGEGETVSVRAAVAGLVFVWSLSACSGGGAEPPDTSPPDTSPPALAEASLVDQATGVPTDLAITLRFSEPMDVASVEAAFAVTGPSGPVVGTLAWDAEHRVATFTPASPYPPSTAFVAALGAGARDVAGNALQGSWQAHFTTAGVPEVDYTFPADGQADVSVQYVLMVKIYFVTRMNGPSVEDAFSLVDGGGRAVGGTAEYYLEDGFIPVLRFTLAAPLAGRTTYTATLAADARSEGGVPLSNPYAFSFTTGPGPQASLWVGNSPASLWLNMFGRVTDDLGRIDCGGVATTCLADYDVGAVVTLTAQAAPAGVFDGWTGDDCFGLTGTSVTLTMSGARSCTARFTESAVPQTLTVTYGPWVARVATVPPGLGVPPAIHCGPLEDPSVCQAGFSAGLPVDLTATPDVGAPAGTIRWTCTGNDLANPGADVITEGGTARVWMTRPKSCNVTFVPAPP